MSNSNPPNLPLRPIPPNDLGYRPASLANLSALRHSGWAPLDSRPFFDIPRLSSFPALDGDASVALSYPTTPLTGPSNAISRRLVRRRNAQRNLRDELAPRSGRSGAISISSNNDGLARSGAGGTPPRNNVPNLAQAPAPAPAPAPAQAPRVQWRDNPPNRTRDDFQRVADERALLRLKQSLTDRFLCYHTSLDALMYWDRDQRRPMWTRMPIPLYRDDWPGHPPVQPGEELDLVMSYQQALDEEDDADRQATQASVRGLLHRFRRPLIRRRRRRDGSPGLDDNPRADRLTTKLVGNFQPAGIQFKRRLGQGGFGAVFLFEMVGEKGVTYPIVVKGSTRVMLDDSEAFNDELGNLNSMNGASHFIQRIFLQDLPFPTASKRRIIQLAARKGIAAVRRAIKQTGNVIRARPFAPGAQAVQLRPVANRPPTTAFGGRQPWRQASPAPEIRLPKAAGIPGYTPQEVDIIRRQRALLDNSRDIIVLENMPRGDIGDLINKLIKRNLTLSNRALWMIFECLFKGCVGMATPGRGQEPGLDGGARAMVEQDETVPMWLHDGTQMPPRPMVHFDLDPQNALVGNFGDPGGPHENVPIVKVADPGLAVIVDDEKRNSEFFLWTSRCRGKAQYLLPEQFSHEWEYRAAIDVVNLAMETTAGSYNWWSNLYQIGWIMWSLITHCFPPAPPRALPYDYASEEAGVVEDQTGFTYGMHVMAMDFRDCDMELRRQILRCLDHDPTKRPKLGWFEAVCMFNVSRPDLVDRESDEQLRAHINDVYGGPA